MSSLAAQLAGAVMMHPAVAAHMATYENVNGELWIRPPLAAPLASLEPRPCPCDAFCFEGQWLQPGTLATVAHAT
eukprot:7997190-Alexandrium_andersonii.AAC.1